MDALPEDIARIIDTLTGQVSEKSLAAASEELTNHYRSDQVGAISSLKKLESHLAYLICRLPATFAVNCQVFSRLKESMGAFTPSSHLDIGSGPASSVIAAIDHFPSMLQTVMIERDNGFIDIAKKLLSTQKGQFSWVAGDCFELIKKTEPCDLVTASYMLSELSPDAIAPFVHDLWKGTNQVLVLVETGTMKGYRTLMRARDALLERGAHIVAPCPHHLACPIPEGDWCHFSVRLARSRQHRVIKGALLGYEDEKYCYLVCSKTPVIATGARVVGAPSPRSGHVHLKLCTLQGALEKIVVSRKMKQEYKRAKSVEWGDVYGGGESS